MLRRILKGIILGLLILIIGVITYNSFIFNKYDKTYNQTELLEQDKDMVKGVINIKKEPGDQIWQGFAGAEIPLVIFNDQYEFLIGKPEESGWEEVTVDSINGVAYYRRPARNPQYFAIRIGKKWAGEVGTLNLLNREYLTGIKTGMPFPLNSLIPYNFFIFKTDMQVVTAIHEMFHAWQAETAPLKFQQANSVYKYEKYYPYENEEFNKQWNKEGEKLKEALAAENKAEQIKLIREFLAIRKERRANITMSPALIGFEKKLEWLEGLAKYAEVKAYELAASRGNTAGGITFNESLPYHRQELNPGSGLGKYDGDYRFYISGMAQARLLGQFGIDWQRRVMEENVFLEDILREVVNKENGNWK
jgi:hypothetical protein